jgi:hypothetical protein
MNALDQVYFNGRRHGLSVSTACTPATMARLPFVDILWACIAAMMRFGIAAAVSFPNTIGAIGQFPAL